MDFKFSKDADGKQPAPVEKGRQSALLLLLLILLGGFSYLYFFTGLIRPQQEQKSAEAPAPQVIKKPLPSLAAQNATHPTASTATPQAAPEPIKPAPAPATTPAAQEVKKSSDTPKTGNPAEKKNVAAPVATVQKEKNSTAAMELDAKKTPAIAASSSKKATPAAGSKADALKVKTAPKNKENATTTRAAKSATKKKGDAVASMGPWTVVVGTYVLEDAMATDMVRVRKAGLDASVEAGPRKKTLMTRLFLSDFPERSAAQAELNKLKRQTSDAFILDQGGSFAVFAGSYFLDGRAVSEKERLAAAGFPLTAKKIEVAIPTKRLIAGKFKDKSAAEAARKKLKEAGFKPVLAH